ncbi:MAG: HAMP domain-containing histidine kinase [Opitutae bacterium]|nr:HAMP domain-containing histidine kinase [Opitutae bacterium]
MNTCAAGQSRTLFAPPERLAPDEILRQSTALGDLAGLADLLDCMPDFVMIVNEQRQIVFGNKPLREFARHRPGGTMLGLRPGEFLDCRQAGLAPSGCGTGEACRTCGAVNAILSGLAGRSVMYECRIATPAVEAYDLRIWASPFRWQTGHYALVIAADISDEKRRQVLEQIFFHDILNTAGSIHGLSELIRANPAEATEFKDDLYQTAEALVDEIRSQRMLLAAERNELPVTLVPASARQVLDSVAQAYHRHPVAKGKSIAISPGLTDFILETDVALLHRVLGNLLKNALEAVRPGATVELGAEERPDGHQFWCHNDGVIPREILLQLFQRSFSTKGPGRGIGTYSIRLLTERYLGGRVSVTSSPEAGTCFTLSFPKRGSAPDGPPPSAAGPGEHPAVSAPTP